jgi:hypothetical protein
MHLFGFNITCLKRTTGRDGILAGQFQNSLSLTRNPGLAWAGAISTAIISLGAPEHRHRLQSRMSSKSGKLQLLTPINAY